MGAYLEGQPSFWWLRQGDLLEGGIIRHVDIIAKNGPVFDCPLDGHEVGHCSETERRRPLLLQRFLNRGRFIAASGALPTTSRMNQR